MLDYYLSIWSFLPNAKLATNCIKSVHLTFLNWIQNICFSAVQYYNLSEFFLSKLTTRVSYVVFLTLLEDASVSRLVSLN